MPEHLGDAFIKLFPQRHIPVILFLILKVGKQMHKQSETDREDWLTTRLYRRLIREPSFRDGPLQVHLQPDIASSEVDIDTHTVEGRLDLQVSCGHGSEVYFAIEAKRLRVALPSGFFSGCREYVTEGMMRFVTGQYAPFMQSGAMLGYVYDGDIKHARTEINRQIQNHASALKLNPPQKLSRSRIIPCQSIDETQHDLDGRYFILYHLLIVVSKDDDFLSDPFPSCTD